MEKSYTINIPPYNTTFETCWDKGQTIVCQQIKTSQEDKEKDKEKHEMQDKGHIKEKDANKTL